MRLCSLRFCCAIKFGTSGVFDIFRCFGCVSKARPRHIAEFAKQLVYFANCCFKSNCWNLKQKIVQLSVTAQLHPSPLDLAWTLNPSPEHVTYLWMEGTLLTKQRRGPKMSTERSSHKMVQSSIRMPSVLSFALLRNLNFKRSPTAARKSSNTHHRSRSLSMSGFSMVLYVHRNHKVY